MKAFIFLVIAVVAVLFFKGSFLSAGGGVLVDEGLYPLKLQYIRGPKAKAGKPTLLEFWATWCGPCRQSIPHLNDLYKRYRSKGLQVVGVTSEEPGVVRDFMRQMPMHYSVARDSSNRYASTLGVRGIPHAFLLDEKGEIMWRGHPMNLGDGDIEAILE